MTEISKISNANVYLNGITLLGQLEEIQLPKITQKMENFSALGLNAEIELPMGVEKMEATLKWNSFYPKALAGANVTTITNLVIRANKTNHSIVGGISQSSVVTIINGVFKSFPVGTYKSKEKVEDIEHVMTVYYLKQIVDNIPVIEVDVWNNIFKIGEIDQLAQFKINQ